MAKNIPNDRILPLEKLLIPVMVAELRGYASTADRYSKIIPAVMPGIPEIAPIIRKYIKKLLEELLTQLRDKIKDAIIIAMTYAASKVIPVINEIIYYVNSIIRKINQVFTQIMMFLRPIFKILVVCGLVYGIGKILLKVIPDAGFGMGFVTIPTTIPKRGLKFITDVAKDCYFYMKNPCGYILAALEKLLKYLSYLSYLQAIINLLKVFEAFMVSNAQSDFSNSASDWDESTNNETPNASNLVECTLPDGSIEQLTPEVCLSRGGTFPGMDLLVQLNDINNQISLLNQQVVIGGVCQCPVESTECTAADCENLTYEECLPPCEWVEDPIVDCLLPDGTIEQIPLSECLDRGGRQLTADELARLLAERDSLMNQLAGLNLDGFMFDGDLVTSLLNSNDNVDVESVTEIYGVNYGFYGIQTGDILSSNPNSDNLGDDVPIVEYPKGGKIKKNKK